MGAVVFSECPLRGAVCVGVFNELKKWYGNETFDGFGKCRCQVDASVVVGVVSCLFLVEWCDPVKFPVVGPGGLCKH